MDLTPAVAGMVEISLTAAGVFYEGRGMASPPVLGANGFSIGTRSFSPIPSRPCLYGQA